MSLISFVFTKAPSHHLDDLQRHTLDQVVTQSATVKRLTTCLTLNSLQDKKKEHQHISDTEFPHIKESTSEYKCDSWSQLMSLVRLERYSR